MEVVYGKFLDFPAITTILEYLEIGRCETLKGPCGAYNLYESELRSNAIISKLDQIVDSLEQIKSNQYKIYQVLSSIENETSALSDSMNQMLERMDDYGENLDQIRRSSEATAYYSQKAACYSEITAVESTTLAFLAMYNSNWWAVREMISKSLDKIKIKQTERPESCIAQGSGRFICMLQRYKDHPALLGRVKSFSMK